MANLLPSNMSWMIDTVTDSVHSMCVFSTLSSFSCVVFIICSCGLIVRREKIDSYRGTDTEKKVKVRIHVDVVVVVVRRLVFHLE